ncbi:hypothetical protein MUP35_04540 [Patescibacteria group bacterium]|nr:hypothetical protein [Patescibacteria group bacterium]
MKNLSSFEIGDEFWVRPNQGIAGAEGFKEGIGGIISTLLQNVYVLAGILLFILLIVGGLSFIMGAGEDNPEKAKRGKQTITAALIGFVIIFCSYWIIKIIEIVTGINIFNSGL